MTEGPILFSAPMVRAILAGHKTQTRRVMKPQPSEGWEPHSYGDVHKMLDGEFVFRNEEPVLGGWGPSSEDGMEAHPCPFGQVGDALWVREAFSSDWILHQTPPREWPSDAPIHYWADGNPEYGDWTPPKPSIHMPRWASRITLEVENVRVERLQDITESDARAEGITNGGCLNCGEDEPCACPDPKPDARESFIHEWDSIYGKKHGCSWADSPWVWVVTFKRVES